jgi:hypothetical protein
MELIPAIQTYTKSNDFMSSSIAALASALSKVQGEIKDVIKNKSVSFGNTSWKHADLPSVLCEIRPLACKNNLSLCQFPTSTDNKVILKSILMHSSGEYIIWDTEIPITGKMDAHSVGKAISYARRYATCCIYGIAQIDDPQETDGIMEDTSSVSYSSSIDTIEHLIKEYSVSKEWVDKCLQAANVSSLRELNEEQSQKMLTALEVKITKQ